MKCGIVTVYNSENCGSFLQAFALSQTLKNAGHEAFFLRHNFQDHSASIHNYTKILLKTALKGNFCGLKLLRERRHIFQNAIQHLQITEDFDSVDCCILGSDVIWDISVPFFNHHRSFFWGTQFEKTKILSYAAAIGFSDAEELEKCDLIREALNRMNSVSVRDRRSQKLLQPYCGKEIELVCDPTYLPDRTEYDQIAQPSDLKDFLFLYCHAKVLPEYIREIQNFARQEGLKTVTFGNFNHWCDIHLAYNPLLFLSLCNQADYIITDTFHGTVFSTIYEKPFAVLKNQKPKVLDILEICAMSDKMTQCPENISGILHSEFRYDITRKILHRQKENSLHYLANALEGCE